MINIVNRTNLNEGSDAANFKGMRFWSPNFFLDQLGILQSFGVKTLRLSDEMFFLNKKYLGIIKTIADPFHWKSVSYFTSITVCFIKSYLKKREIGFSFQK